VEFVRLHKNPRELGFSCSKPFERIELLWYPTLRFRILLGDNAANELEVVR
jgi:hypothetical protein